MGTCTTWQQERDQLEFSLAEAKKIVATMTPQLTPNAPNMGTKMPNGARRATVQHVGRLSGPGTGLGRTEPPSSQLSSTISTPSSIPQSSELPRIPDIDLTAIRSRAEEELAHLQSQIDQLKPLEPIEAVLTD